jgi:hypothetical protein
MGSCQPSGWRYLQDILWIKSKIPLCIAAFSLISLGLFLLTWPETQATGHKLVFYIQFMRCFLVVSFVVFGPILFSLIVIVLQISNAADLEQFQQLANRICCTSIFWICNQLV